MIQTLDQNPWLLPEVADAQLELVREQLAQDAMGNPPAPFAAFHRAMKAMPILCARVGMMWDLLDVGCGVGHYGALCQRHYPRVRYWGTDISTEMIHRAIQENALRQNPTVYWFKKVPFTENDFGAFPFIFVSQALEMTADPLASLHLVLDRAQHYVILHRLRVPLTDEPSRRTIERTYLGHMAPNMEWNMKEVEDIAKRYGEIIYSDVWDTSLTMIVEKP